MPLTPSNPAAAPALHPAFRMILPYLRPIERLILDPEISEIMVNSPSDVFVEKHGILEKVPEVAISAEQLRVAVQNIARSLGDDISEEQPILDSRLPDGSRIAAVLPPCSIQGITLTIRKFNTRSFTVHDLIRIGTITEPMAEFLQRAIIDRKNILISGGTGTGKTTLLNILADFIPDDDRLLVIEDTAEIHIRKPNLVRFEARRQQGPKVPAVTIRDLLKASLRHRPERTILGEIRGEEAFDLLQALNTGHCGSLSTIHANSARQALSRLASCVLQSGIDLPYKAIKASIADSIHLLVHIERRHGTRRINEIVAIESYSPTDDSYRLETVFKHGQQHLSQE
jgi:pilus assembly protein CpaF